MSAPATQPPAGLTRASAGKNPDSPDLGVRGPGGREALAVLRAEFTGACHPEPDLVCAVSDATSKRQIRRHVSVRGVCHDRLGARPWPSPDRRQSEPWKVTVQGRKSRSFTIMNGNPLAVRAGRRSPRSDIAYGIMRLPAAREKPPGPQPAGGMPPMRSDGPSA